MPDLESRDYTGRSSAVRAARSGQGHLARAFSISLVCPRRNRRRLSSDHVAMQRRIQGGRSLFRRRGAQSRPEGQRNERGKPGQLATETQRDMASSRRLTAASAAPPASRAVLRSSGSFVVCKPFLTPPPASLPCACNFSLLAPPLSGCLSGQVLKWPLSGMVVTAVL